MTNKQYFQNDSREKLHRFIDTLLDEAYDKSNCWSDLFNDIHIFPPGDEQFCVEWVQLPWSHEYGGDGFVYVDEDCVVLKEYTFPDKSIEYLHDDEEYNDLLEDWLKDNPGWVKNDWGMWTNEIENKEFREKLEKQKANNHPENEIPQQ